MSVDDRNRAVESMIKSFFAEAGEGNFTYENNFKDDLDLLFSTTTWGYREVILVVVIGRLLDPQYCASSAFYSCNPRALYEKPIRNTLLEYRIPNRKSGPLNVAKATVALNGQWAAQRDCPEVAQAAVRLVNLIETFEKDELENFAIALHAKFLSEASRVASLTVQINETADPIFLYNLCWKLISEVPDAGNTPQRITGLLLKNYHESLNTGVMVTGYNDRASVTSTTSKKPGDINEESQTGDIYKVYEVTVKPFSEDRIRDSYDTVSIYNENNDSQIDEVIVICRDVDCPQSMVKSELKLYLGKYEYEDLIYYFMDIYEWMFSILLKITEEGRENFYSDLNDYISDVNTAEKVKHLWIQLHS